MYSVMVVASDGTNDGAMGVTVTVTDVDENVAPEFAEDTTTREVEGCPVLSMVRESYGCIIGDAPTGGAPVW